MNRAQWGDFVKRLYHDHRGEVVNKHCTKHPLFTVQEKRRVLGFDSAYSEDMVFVEQDSGDYTEFASVEEYLAQLDPQEIERLDAVFVDSGYGGIHDASEWEQLDVLESCDHHLEETGYKDEWVHVCAT